MGGRSIPAPGEPYCEACHLGNDEPCHPEHKAWQDDQGADNSRTIKGVRYEVAAIDDHKFMDQRDGLNLGKWLTEDFKEKLAHRYDREVMALFVEEDKSLEQLTVLFKDYYDEAEEIDRCYPHVPSRHKRGGTIPVPTSPTWRRQYYQQIRALIAKRTARIGDLNPKQYDENEWLAKLKQAARDGLRRHEDELEPCPCSVCWRG